MFIDQQFMKIYIPQLEFYSFKPNGENFIEMV